MANKNTRRARAKAASRNVATEPQVTEPEPEAVEQQPVSRTQTTTGPGWAVWILSRFPGVRNNYQTWGRGKRIFVAILLYLISLPIIPIVVMIVWYIRDPEGFKKSPMLPVLVAITAAWFGGFGYIANQTPVTDGSPYANVKPASDGEQSTATDKPDAVPSQAAKDKIANQKASKPTNGKKFVNCTDAFDQGVFDIKRNDPSYERRLDRDNDGIACEK